MELSALIDSIKKQIAFEKNQEDFSPSYKSFNLQYGILLSVEEAEAIIEALSGK